MVRTHLSIDPYDLEMSKSAAAAEGISWSKYAARAIKRQALTDNYRRAAEYDKTRSAEDLAEQAARDQAAAMAIAQDGHCQPG